MKSGFLVSCGTLLAILAAASQAHAQGAPRLPYGIGDAVREGERSSRPPLPETGAAPTLPQLREPQFTLKDKATLLVRRFRVEGPPLVDEQQVRAILAPYEGRKLTITKIYEAADRLTTLYRERGYMVAKAYIPVQNARGGVLRVKVVAGQYGKITVRNESLVKDSFVNGTVDSALNGAPAIHRDSLERLMLLLASTPGAGTPHIAIAPGQRPETSDFIFDVPASRRVEGFLLGDNYGTPFTGRWRSTAGLTVNSPLGVGDRFSASGLISENSELKNGYLSYAFPLGYNGLRAEISGFRTTYALGGDFEGLDATGTATGVNANLIFPWLLKAEESVYLAGKYTHKSLNDNILGISFADRTIDSGTATITRNTESAIVGHPLTTSTSLSVTVGNLSFSDPAQEAFNRAGPNTVGTFGKINLTFDATLALTQKLSLTLTAKGQKSLSGNLDTNESLALTGYWGVRSFNEGLSGDSGFLITPELKYALPSISRLQHAVGLFTDVGAVWLEDGAYTTTQKSRTQLNDVGIGYYATYEYLPSRFFILKAQLAHSYGTNGGAEFYDEGTRALVQGGLTY